MRWLLLIALLGTSTATLRAEEKTFTSGDSRTHLLELFTSEGCSSCPPAEEWFSKLKSDPRLWHEFVPLAFHVDYWDRLGWKDRFSQPEWTKRQQAYAAAWNSSSVYTPGFVLDGREWQESGARILSLPASPAVGSMSARVGNGSVVIKFTPGTDFHGGSAHFAWLGFDLLSNVRAGENSGRSLRHDFVVLRQEASPLRLDAAKIWTAELQTTAPPEAGALACWIEAAGIPIQATGGWLTRAN